MMRAAVLFVFLNAICACATTRHAVDRCDPYASRTCATQAHLAWLESVR